MQLRAARNCLYALAMNKHVGLDEKLAVLQASDGYRKWYSLDDQRVCILCEKLINGRMIDIWQDHDGTYMLHTPYKLPQLAPIEYLPAQTTQDMSCDYL
jgi:hypothetical protein